MTEQDPHSSPIKTPRQLIFVVALAFLVPITVIGLLSQLFTSGGHDAAENEQRVLARIKPVGAVVIAEASAPHGAMTGEQVYGQVCKTCHDAGLAGAPKAGDKAAWKPRIAEGEQTLVQHAIGGYQGKTGVMPPKGGSTDLTDDEVHRAVVYLANQGGAAWNEPVPTATASASSASAVATTAASTATAAGAAPAPASAAASAPSSQVAGPKTVAMTGASPDGKKVYEGTCHVCHATGLAGAPKFGDKAGWAPRIATGIETLHSVALKGLNAMPPRGGNMTLSDAEVKAAVDYMVAAAK